MPFASFNTHEFINRLWKLKFTSRRNIVLSFMASTTLVTFSSIVNMPFDPAYLSGGNPVFVTICIFSVLTLASFEECVVTISKSVF